MPRPDTDLYCETYGIPTNPAMIFLHGGPGANTWAFEKSCAEKLAEKYFVVAYDQRGSGRSNTPFDASQFTLTRFTQDLDDVIVALELESPVLVGFSWGGFLSLNYLERYPGKAKGVVLVCSPIDFPAAYLNMLGVIERLVSRFHPQNWAIEKKLDRSKLHAEDDVSDILRRLGILRAVKTLRTKMFADGRPPFNLQSEHVRSVWELVRGSGLFFSPVILGDSEFVELLLDLSNEPDFDAWYTQVNPNAGEWLQRNEPGIANKSHIPLLKRVKSRVRAIYSREDRLFSRAQMDEIADVLGAGRFSYIDGSGHYVYLEKRREFCEVLSRHLDAM